MKLLFAASFIIATIAVAAPARAIDVHTYGASHLRFVRYSPISVKVKANLAGEKVGNLAHIKVDTNNDGGVFLSGDVKSREEADKAVSIARATQGVTSVTSTIQISKKMIRMIV